MIPHPDSKAIAINCAIITVSDTRTPETDKSGQLIRQLLTDAGHNVVTYGIVKDEPAAIEEWLIKLDRNLELDVIIFNGGTGIAPRDTTYDVISGLLDKTLPGFGEIFRYLSYQEIGSRAIASRAVAGVKNHKLLFSLPGSSNAVKLAVRELILPELNHLVSQLKG
ncbi:MogA/MoaB family molybdenum cofactor biosynthesis protein [Waterburya agarophytonicola K14]|uniref:Molybdenum cofactor biosynthesis protein B n=1 Tax=Waterburya agarophytonicola KI4 TaxID=2874699 RepID=A0A964BPG5_9CYAN|nr:MogA/MoaB family molybdenum cofactor biosynthesis protein [Waterburya agarophytonicola]MCC0176406.1 MogA/MoaB family molybdenum cofactor biosynthesis protein [Waterburya agarophytonicola KI4]